MWDASVVISRILERHSPITLVGKRTVELGSGCCGLPGMVAAAFGADVILSDIYEELCFLQKCLDSNSHNLPTNISVMELNWSRVHKITDLPLQLQKDIDIIICADLVYELTYKDLLMCLLVMFQASPSVSVLMSNTPRKHVYLFQRKISRYCDVQNVEISNEIISEKEMCNQLVWLITRNQDIEIPDDVMDILFSSL